MSRAPAPERSGEPNAPEATSDVEARPLEILGLDARCALVYTHLCVHGGSKAGPIAAATRLGRGDVYRALDILVDRGYVVAGAARPIVYAAVDPGEVFARALGESRVRSAELAEAARVLAVWWASAIASRRSDSEGFRHLEGEEDIDAAARRLSGSSRRVVLVLDRRSPRSLRSAGLRAEAIRAGLPAGTELRLVEDEGALSSWFLVADEKEVLFLDETTPPASDAQAKLRATWTDSATLVAMAVALHGSLWARTPAGTSPAG